MPEAEHASSTTQPGGEGGRILDMSGAEHAPSNTLPGGGGGIPD